MQIHLLFLYLYPEIGIFDIIIVLISLLKDPMFIDLKIRVVNTGRENIPSTG